MAMFQLTMKLETYLMPFVTAPNGITNTPSSDKRFATTACRLIIQWFLASDSHEMRAGKFSYFHKAGAC